MSRYWKFTLQNYFNEFLEGKIEVKEFCELYEKYWNLSLSNEKLDQDEFNSLSKLYYTVAWYSPNKSDRERNPKYKNNHEIKSAVIKTTEKISWPN